MTRAKRLAELIKKEISRIIREEVSDPRIGFVSITQVDASPDLKSAKIYVSIFGGDKDKKEAMFGLFSATGYIRNKLARLLSLRSAPEIRFIKDESIERGSRVLSIISKLENEKTDLGKNKKSVKKR